MKEGHHRSSTQYEPTKLIPRTIDGIIETTMGTESRSERAPNSERGTERILQKDNNRSIERLIGENR